MKYNVPAVTECNVIQLNMENVDLPMGEKCTKAPKHSFHSPDNTQTNEKRHPFVFSNSFAMYIEQYGKISYIIVSFHWKQM